MRVIINSCLVTELFANFQTSIDRKSIICTINKGKPVDSNGIATWIPIPEFSIYCHLKVV